MSKTGDLSDPIVANGLLYVSYSIYSPGFSKLLSTSLLALHTVNGSEAWNRQVNDYPIQVESGILYASASLRQMTAYDAKSGKDLWNTQYRVDVSAKLNQQDG